MPPTAPASATLTLTLYRQPPSAGAPRRAREGSLRRQRPAKDNESPQPPTPPGDGRRATGDGREQNDRTESVLVTYRWLLVLGAVLYSTINGSAPLQGALAVMLDRGRKIATPKNAIGEFAVTLNAVIIN